MITEHVDTHTARRATAMSRELRVGGCPEECYVPQDGIPTWERTLHPEIGKAIPMAVDRCSADIREGMRAAAYAAAVIDTFLVPVEIALHEAFMNALRHGNGCDARLVAVFRWTVFADGFEVEVTDAGPGFDLDSVPDCTNVANLGSEHGRGILLMRTFMDDVTFHGRNNHVTLRKSFP